MPFKVKNPLAGISANVPDDTSKTFVPSVSVFASATVSVTLSD